LSKDRSAQSDASNVSRALVEEKQRAAELLRRLIEALTKRELSQKILSELIAVLGQQTATLETLPEREGRKSFGKGSSTPDQSFYYEHSPLRGSCSPLAPPLSMEILDRGIQGKERVEGKVTFGWAYEGPPGHVHGGLVAAIFDELLGTTQSLSGQPGLTGKLTVRFREPTPLHTELRLVGTFDRIEGRRIFTTGKLYAGDRLCADAQGLFMRLHPEHYEDLESSRQAVTERASKSD
jgi:acyl-coenzyme A thioesterase PaaI-like protein